MDTNAYACMCTHIIIQGQEKPNDKKECLFIYYLFYNDQKYTFLTDRLSLTRQHQEIT